MNLPTELFEGLIKRGAILHSTMFNDIDHGKFFVIIGVSKNLVVGFFFINTNIHKSLYGKKEQFALQYPLKHSDYTFLRYNSYLCATDIITRDRKYIAESIKSGKTQYIGELKQEHIEDVLDMVRNSKLFSKIEKETYFS